MLFKLFTLLCIGLAAVGVMLLAAKALGLKSAKKYAPLVAALAVISYETWSRYTWADRMIDSMPPETVVVERYPYTGMLEPWTAVFPRDEALLTLKTDATMTNQSHPHVRLVLTQLWQRDEERLELRQFVDCAHGRRVPAGGGFTENGMPPDDAWTADKESPLFRAACR